MQRLKIVCLAPVETRTWFRAYRKSLSGSNFAMMASFSSGVPPTSV